MKTIHQIVTEWAAKNDYKIAYFAQIASDYREYIVHAPERVIWLRGTDEQILEQLNA